MFTQDELQTITSTIHAHDNILCISHVGPDGDAVGSLLGMGWMLQRMGKRYTVSLQDRVPDNLTTLPGAEKVVSTAQIRSDYGLIISLDASSVDRLGKIYQPDIHSTIPLLVIDHHVTNTNFGDVNWVAPQCASTCQMLVSLADALEIDPDGELAECLLTGVVTDTLCFRTSNTDDNVLEAAMRLMRGGADLAAITARTLNRRPFSLLKLWGAVLPAVHLEDGVIWATVSQKQYAMSGYDSDSELNMSSMLVSTIGADMSATFAEKMDEKGQPTVECSFRAKPGFNVSDMAFELGGGGHPPASGCTLPGSLDEVSEHVVGLMKDARRLQANSK